VRNEREALLNGASDSSDGGVIMAPLLRDGDPGVGIACQHVLENQKCPPERQGLTLVHFSAQLKRILWDRGAFRVCLGGV
jgi:hypothetical protein